MASTIIGMLYVRLRHYLTLGFKPQIYNIFHLTLFFGAFSFVLSYHSVNMALSFFVISTVFAMITFTYRLLKSNDSIFDKDFLDFGGELIITFFGGILAIYSVLTYFFGESVYTAASVLYYFLYWYTVLGSTSFFGTVEIDYFIHQYSEQKPKWIEGSVSLSSGLTSLEEGEMYEAYYYLWVAERKYKSLSRLEERKPYSEIASLQMDIASELRETIVDKVSHRTHMNRAKESLREAEEKSKFRYCDNCGDKVHMEEVYVSLENGEIIEWILCEDCYSTRYGSGREESTSSRTNSRTSEEKRDTKRENRKTPSGPSTRGNEELEKACSILGVSEPLTEEEIKEAFREKSFEFHPDQGGSREKFVELQEARRTALQYVESDD